MIERIRLNPSEPKAGEKFTIEVVCSSPPNCCEIDPGYCWCAGCGYPLTLSIYRRRGSIWRKIDEIELGWKYAECGDPAIFSTTYSLDKAGEYKVAATTDFWCGTDYPTACDRSKEGWDNKELVFRVVGGGGNGNGDGNGNGNGNGDGNGNGNGNGDGNGGGGLEDWFREFWEKYGKWLIILIIGLVVLLFVSKFLEKRKKKEG